MWASVSCMEGLLFVCLRMGGRAYDSYKCAGGLVEGEPLITPQI